MSKDYRNKRKIFSQYNHNTGSGKSGYYRQFVKEFTSNYRTKIKSVRSIKSISEDRKLINDTETMIYDEKTGGIKGSKNSQIGFIDPAALYELGKVAGMGIIKYDKYNYLKGYDWSLSYNALMRHMQQMWAGEEVDQESGLLHSVHAAWHALALASFQMRDLGNDDRYKGA